MCLMEINPDVMLNICWFYFSCCYCCFFFHILVICGKNENIKLQVLNSRITSNGLVSTMTYLAPTDSELTLACWASNAVGRQEIPCLIHIIPASKWFEKSKFSNKIPLHYGKCMHINHNISSFGFRIARTTEILWTSQRYNIRSCVHGW